MRTPQNLSEIYLCILLLEDAVGSPTDKGETQELIPQVIPCPWGEVLGGVLKPHKKWLGHPYLQLTKLNMIFSLVRITGRKYKLIESDLCTAKYDQTESIQPE